MRFCQCGRSTLSLSFLPETPSRLLSFNQEWRARAGRGKREKFDAHIAQMRIHTQFIAAETDCVALMAYIVPHDF